MKEKKTFRCEICEASFTKKANMIDHIVALHEGVKPIKCQLCHYSCATKHNLRRHISSNHQKQNTI